VIRLLRARARIDALVVRIIAYNLSRRRWTVARHYSRVLAANQLALAGEIAARRKTRLCPFCGWEGRSFFPLFGTNYLIPNESCPICASMARTRLLSHYLHQRPELLPPGARVLEAAPLAHFQRHLRQRQGIHYCSFDLSSAEAMTRSDITRLAFADDSFHLIICYHVLEHVPEDRRAMAELRRVLHPNGHAIIQVPIDEALPQTEEYGAPRPELHGHVRMYGLDYRRHLEGCGFQVEVDDLEQRIDEATARRFGLTLEKIYVARKAAPSTATGG